MADGIEPLVGHRGRSRCQFCRLLGIAAQQAVPFLIQEKNSFLTHAQSDFAGVSSFTDAALLALVVLERVESAQLGYSFGRVVTPAVNVSLSGDKAAALKPTKSVRMK
jgi:hypothetical protein